MKKLLLIFLLAATCDAAVVYDRDIYDVADRKYHRSILEAMSFVSVGTAEGQLLYWDAAASVWLYADVTKLKWDDVANTLLVDTLNLNNALTVPYGGIGAITLTDGGLLVGSGTSAITALPVLADGEFIVGDGTTDPVAESGNTARTSLGLGTGDSPTWAGATLTNAAIIGSDSAVFQPNANSTTFLQVLDADGGTPILNIDTTNERVGVGTASPDEKLHIEETNGVCNLKIVAGNGSGGLFLESYRQHSKTHVYFQGLAARGTKSSPLRVESGDHLFRIIALGYNAGGNFGVAVSEIRVAAANAFVNQWDARGNIDFMLYDGTTQRSKLKIESSNVIINDYGIDLDFRVKSDNNINALFVEGSSGYVGIWETAPETLTEWTHAQPYLTLHNDTHEDTDGGRESRLNFKGEQSGGEETTLARIEVGHDGTANDEKGYLDIFINSGSDGDSPTKRVRIDTAGVKIGDGGTTDYVEISPTGDTIFVGSAGLIFGSMYNDNTDTTVTIGTSGVAERIPSGFTAGQLNGVTFGNNRELTVTEPGMYKIDWSISFRMVAGANHEIEGAIGVGGTKNAQGSAHRFIGTNTDTGNMTGTAILDLADNAVISLMMENDSNTENIVVNHASLTLVQVGGT